MDGTDCTINDDLMRFVNGVCLFGAILKKEEGIHLFRCIKKGRGVYGHGDFCLVGKFLVFCWHIPFNRSAIFVFSTRACGSGNNEVVEHVVS